MCTGVCVLSSFECVGAFAIAMCVKQRATGTEECVQMSARGAREPMQAAEKKNTRELSMQGRRTEGSSLAAPPHTARSTRSETARRCCTEATGDRSRFRPPAGIGSAKGSKPCALSFCANSYHGRKPLFCRLLPIY